MKNISELRDQGYDPSSIEEAEQWNARWERFLTSPIGEFLAMGDPAELWDNPGQPLVDMASIARGVQELAPDSILFKFGLLPIYTSIGGNVIAYHRESGGFYWADHERICGDEYVRLRMTYESLPLTFENLMKALVKMSDNECGTFLRELREGKYDAEIEELDCRG